MVTVGVSFQSLIESQIKYRANPTCVIIKAFLKCNIGSMLNGQIITASIEIMCWQFVVYLHKSSKLAGSNYMAVFFKQFSIGSMHGWW